MGTRIVDAEEQLLSSGFDFAWVFDRLESTMNEGRMLLARYQEAGPLRLGVVVAHRQLAGRGRQGRGWVAAENSFSATFVSHLNGDVARLQGIGLAIGCSIAAALESLGGSVGLKWPNDIVVRGPDRRWRKLGGILVEADPLHGGISLTIGVGINLKGAPEIVDTATDFEREFRRPVKSLELCTAIGTQLRVVLEHFAATESGFLSFRQEWIHRCIHMGYNIIVDAGNSSVTGKVCGVSPTGALEVQTDTGVVNIVSGHVISLGVEGDWIKG